jgi:hypothetical protein
MGNKSMDSMNWGILRKEKIWFSLGNVAYVMDNILSLSLLKRYFCNGEHVYDEC